MWNYLYNFVPGKGNCERFNNIEESEKHPQEQEADIVANKKEAKLKI